MCSRSLDPCADLLMPVYPTVANFGTDATGFSRLFPGLKPHLLTLASNFQLPLYRELLLSLGVCSVSMKSCQNILRQGKLAYVVKASSL